MHLTSIRVIYLLFAEKNFLLGLYQKMVQNNLIMKVFTIL
nr:MAG TPA: hypothetical protein [Caudoviricetes sp.]